MAAKVIDDNASGVLVLIIPIALALVLLFTAWPVLLALVLVGAVLRIWQRYQWLQWSQQIDPIFRQLIQANQGCLTTVDLAMKANISGTAAKQYLDNKAQEFGIRAIVYEDKGTVYYFTTARTLTSLLDESESPKELDLEPSTVETQAVLQPPDIFELPPPETQQQPTESPIEAQQSPTEELEGLEELEEPATPGQPPKKLMPFGSLIQIELAQRLGVHSSTVYKRRYEPNFPEWSKSRDPEGIAWEYSEETKEFYPQEKS